MPGSNENCEGAARARQSPSSFPPPSGSLPRAHRSPLQTTPPSNREGEAGNKKRWQSRARPRRRQPHATRFPKSHAGTARCRKPGGEQRGPPKPPQFAFPPLHVLQGWFAASGLDLLPEQKPLHVSGSEGRTCLLTRRVSTSWGTSAPWKDRSSLPRSCQATASGPRPPFAPPGCLHSLSCPLISPKKTLPAGPGTGWQAAKPAALELTLGSPPQTAPPPLLPRSPTPLPDLPAASPGPCPIPTPVPTPQQPPPGPSIPSPSPAWPRSGPGAGTAGTRPHSWVVRPTPTRTLT